MAMSAAVSPACFAIGGNSAVHDGGGGFIPYADWTPEIHARYANIIHPPREAPTVVPAPAMPVVAQIEEGVAVLYALCLLHVWAKPADRRSFELGMILMQKDVLRGRVINKQPAPSRGTAASASVGNMDEFLGELVGTNTLVVEDAASRQVVKLGNAAPGRNELMQEADGRTAFSKAEEAVKAVAALAERSQSLDLYVGAEDYGPVEIAIS